MKIRKVLSAFSDEIISAIIPVNDVRVKVANVSGPKNVIKSPMFMVKI
jgi:hypothetical protein